MCYGHLTRLQPFAVEYCTYPRTYPQHQYCCVDSTHQPLGQYLNPSPDKADEGELRLQSTLSQKGGPWYGQWAPPDKLRNSRLPKLPKEHSSQTSGLHLEKLGQRDVMTAVRQRKGLVVAGGRQGHPGTAPTHVVEGVASATALDFDRRHVLRLLLSSSSWLLGQEAGGTRLNHTDRKRQHGQTIEESVVAKGRGRAGRGGGGG